VPCSSNDVSKLKNKKSSFIDVIKVTDAYGQLATLSVEF